jgi:hypothetical protein
VETCDGRRHKARIRDGRLVVVDPNGLGWIKTITGPGVVAGVNLPEAETDLTPLSRSDADEALAGVFEIKAQARPDVQAAAVVEKPRPVWREVAWVLLALVMMEPLLANLARRT